MAEKETKRNILPAYSKCSSSGLGSADVKTQTPSVSVLLLSLLFILNELVVYVDEDEDINITAVCS